MTNATLKLIQDFGDYFQQSEKAVIVEVGMALGVVMSVCIVLCLYCSASVYVDTERRDSPMMACCKPRARDLTPGGGLGHDGEEESDGVSLPGATGPENALSTLDTEGAYRSDSESDDGGEGKKVALAAQKLARRASGI